MDGRSILKSIMRKFSRLKSGIVVGASLGVLTLGACATNSQPSYQDGYQDEHQSASPNGNVYDSVADCSQVPGTNCAAPISAPAPVYVPPAPIPPPAPKAASYGVPVNCPPNTTPVGDGTCMMNAKTPPPTGYVPPADYTAPSYQPIRK